MKDAHILAAVINEDISFCDDNHRCVSFVQGYEALQECASKKLDGSGAYDHKYKKPLNFLSEFLNGDHCLEREDADMPEKWIEYKRYRTDNYEREKLRDRAYMRTFNREYAQSDSDCDNRYCCWPYNRHDYTMCIAYVEKDLSYCKEKSPPVSMDCTIDLAAKFREKELCSHLEGRRGMSMCLLAVKASEIGATS